MLDSDNNDYTKLYVRRQEQFLVEQIKKSIDLDVKFTMLSSILEDLRKEYTETKAQLDMQIDISNKTAVALQEHMQTNKDLEALVVSLNEKVADLDKKLLESLVERSNLSEELQACNKKNEGFEKELVRQRNEMQEIFDENKELKTKKTINKKKPVEDDSDF
jgi:CRISPR/Cas system-associated endonuclease Cas3-HD